MRFVRAVFVPEDGACLLVFEAADAQAVREAAVAAGLNLSQLTAVLTAKEE